MLQSEQRKNETMKKDKKKAGAELDLNAGIVAPVRANQKQGNPEQV